MMNSLFGINVVVVPDVPRYTLPAELLPGVPWPAGFRDEINAWSLSFLGTTNVCGDNVYFMQGDNAFMNPRCFAILKNVAKELK